MRKMKTAAAFSALLLVFATLSFAEKEKEKATPKKEASTETYKSRRGFSLD